MKLLNVIIGGSVAAAVIVGLGAVLVFFKTTGVFETMLVSWIVLGLGLGLAGWVLGASVGAIGGHGHVAGRVLGHGGLAAGQIAALAYWEGMVLKGRGVIHLGDHPGGSNLGYLYFVALLAALTLVGGLGRAISNSGFEIAHQAKSRYAGGLLTLLTVALGLALMHR